MTFFWVNENHLWCLCFFSLLLFLLLLFPLLHLLPGSQRIYFLRQHFLGRFKWDTKIKSSTAISLSDPTYYRYHEKQEGLHLTSLLGDRVSLNGRILFLRCGMNYECGWWLPPCRETGFYSRWLIDWWRHGFHNVPTWSIYPVEIHRGRSSSSCCFASECDKKFPTTIMVVE